MAKNNGPKSDRGTKFQRIADREKSQAKQAQSVIREHLRPHQHKPS